MSDGALAYEQPTDQHAAGAPPLPVFYRTNSRGLTRAELASSSHSVFLVNSAWIVFKLVGPRIPISTDDPAVESLLPFETTLEGIVQPIRDLFARGAAELALIGFQDPAYHCISDPLQKTDNFLATFSHPTIAAVARLHVRVLYLTVPAKSNVFAEFFTPLADGEYLWTLSSAPDIAIPPSFRVTRAAGVEIAELWNRHKAAMEVEASVGRIDSVPLHTTRDAVAECERVHEKVRDFHLARGLFTPLTAADRSRVQRHSAHAALRHTSRYPQVLSEIDRLLTRSSGWRGSLNLLAVSLVFFLIVGIEGISWPQLLALVPILLFHEGGHYLAMRAFGYRNLRMFFIPAFGAAVTGRAFNIAGWKRAVTFLAGPLPGIFIALPIGFAGMVWHSELALQAALLTLVLNGFNLLPVLPLDGGHLLNITLFSRHHVAQTIFRALAAVGLAAFGIAVDRPIFIGLGIFTCLGIPASLRQARLVRTLRAKGIGRASNGADDSSFIPVPVADEIIETIAAGRKRPPLASLLAAQTIDVYEDLNSRPPGWFATIALLGAHLVGLVTALAFVVIFVLAQRGTLDGILDREYVPEYRASARDIAVSPSLPPAAPEPPLSPARTSVLVASYTTEQQAAAAFRALPRPTPPHERAVLFGHTILIRFSADDDDTRRRWIDQVGGAAETFVQSDAWTASFDVVIPAPDEAAARRLADELEMYFELPLTLGLRAPWSTSPLRAEELDCRRTYAELSSALHLWNEPEYRKLLEQLDKNRRLGNTVQAEALAADLETTTRRLELMRIRAIVDRTPPASPQADLARRFLLLRESAPLSPQNYAVPPVPIEEFLPLLGAAADHPSDASHALSGYLDQEGRTVHLYGVSFPDPTVGLPALAAWLARHGVTSLHCDLDATPADSSDEDY